MASKLITLSADDEADAQKKLQEWLDKDDKVLLVILGDTNIAFDTAAKADHLSGGVLNEPEWVIHSPNRDFAIPMLSELEDPDLFVDDWNKVLLIALSLTDVIRDMIVRDGSTPTIARIQDAWIATGN